MDADTKKLVGRTLEGRYQIEAIAGTGGFAVVYRARHIGLQRPVALKVLHSDPVFGPTMRARFEREARVLAALSHPNIVGVTDFGVTENQPYLVMELLEGELLRDVIDQGRMPIDRAVGIARQILDGLAHAHEQGVVHLDLKPTNVLLQREGDGRDRVKILDFGFAKWFGNAARDDETPLTMAGQAGGTPGYVAPERMAGLATDARADLYAVGAILFEMVAGRRAYEGEALDVMRAQLQRPPPSLASIRPDLQGVRELDEVVRKAMAREPPDRWSDAAEMRAALASVKAHKRGRVGRTAVFVAAVVILGVIALWPGNIARLADQPTERSTEVPDDSAESVRASAAGAPSIGGRDPFADPMPPELASFYQRLEAGERVPTRQFGPLYGYIRQNPSDPRPHLLFGRAYMRLGWRDAALQRYVRAHQIDPTSRGDPAMLRDLLILATQTPVGGAAARSAATIYDREALPAIDRVLAAVENRPAAAERVRWVRDRIATR